MPPGDLRLLDAAQRAVKMINELIDRSPRGQLLYVSQLHDSVQAIAANISEGLGRGPGRDRTRSMSIARGETEEAIQHLGANFRSDRITPSDYWPRHNLLVVLAKMDHGVRPRGGGARALTAPATFSQLGSCAFERRFA